MVLLILRGCVDNMLMFGFLYRIALQFGVVSPINEQTRKVSRRRSLDYAHHCSDQVRSDIIRRLFFGLDQVARAIRTSV